MVLRSFLFWITMVTSSLLVGSAALGDARHLRPGHAQSHAHRHVAPPAHQPPHKAPHRAQGRAPSHVSPPAHRHTHKPPHVSSGHTSVPRTGIPKKFRSRGKPSIGKSGRRSRKSSARRSLAQVGGLRSLPRAAYPTDLRGPTEVDGRFLRPIDGDTFAMNGIKVRVNGIDAPELGTPGGSEAALRLAAMLQEGQVTIVPRSRDVYGRTVADVFMNGQNLGERMIAEGYARRG